MIDLRNKDLNLLHVFAILYRERNVSRAARLLNLSQSTLSHALVRLRAMFEDDLFVRVARGVVPTRRANELAPQVEALLGQAQNLFHTGHAFDPIKAHASIRMASTEYFELLALPKLVADLRRTAPGITIQSTSTNGYLPKDLMATGAVDVAIAGFFGELPEGFYKQKLFSDTFCCVVRKGHALAKRRQITVDEYLSHEHVLISPQGDMVGAVDKTLGKRKVRRVVAGMASFLTPAWVVAQSDLVLTAPRRLAQLISSHLPLAVIELPFEVPPITIVQVWHERVHRDPIHQWLRAKLLEFTAEPNK